MRFPLIAFAIASATLPLVADTVVLDYSIAYAGDAKPSGEAPWLRATLSDVKGDLGTAVLLTFEASGLRSDEFVSSWAFNFRESIDPGSIRITETDRTKFEGKPDPQLGRQDGIRAGGGYRFDLDMNFPTSQAERFGVGSTYTVRLEREGGLSIYDLLVNTTSRGYGDSLSVAHIQSLDNGGSVWVSAGDRFSANPETSGLVAVPEPSTWAAGVAVAGLAGGAFLRQRRARR